MSFLIRKPYKLCSFTFRESLFLKVLLSFTLRDDIRDPGMVEHVLWAVEGIDLFCAAHVLASAPSSQG